MKNLFINGLNYGVCEDYTSSKNYYYFEMANGDKLHFAKAMIEKFESCDDLKIETKTRP